MLTGSVESSEISSVNDPENEAVIKKIIEVVGGPRNYGPTPEEQEEQERKHAVEKQQRLMQDAAERALREAEEETRMTALLEEWVIHTLLWLKDHWYKTVDLIPYQWCVEALHSLTF